LIPSSSGPDIQKTLPALDVALDNPVKCAVAGQLIQAFRYHSYCVQLFSGFSQHLFCTRPEPTHVTSSSIEEQPTQSFMM